MPISGTNGSRKRLVGARQGARMASGRSNKIVGQTGEYLVAAELGRRGLIATAFTGNVPHYDIIASDDDRSQLSPNSRGIGIVRR